MGIRSWAVASIRTSIVVVGTWGTCCLHCVSTTVVESRRVYASVTLSSVCAARKDHSAFVAFFVARSLIRQKSWFIDALFSLCHVAWAKFIAEDDIRQIIISMWLTPSALSDIGSVHALRKDVYRDTAQE